MRLFTRFVASAEADSVFCNCPILGTAVRAFPCRRFTAEVTFVLPLELGFELCKKVIRRVLATPGFAC
jgi:hypothetical protein